MSTFCPLLFQHLATHPHGGVTHCCIADHRNSISSARTGNHYLNVNTNTIDEIFNSNTFKTARIQSLNNIVPPACARCFREENAGIESKRQSEIKNYPMFTRETAQAITDSTGYIQNIQFDTVELRLGNTCNVACRTCNPASSSKWVEDYKKLSSVISFTITDYSNLNGFNWPDNIIFWNDLLAHCKDIKTFYINGGEPTLVKQHFIFLENLIKLGKTDIDLIYNINMTILTEDIINLWNKFKSVTIHCSIDDLGERNSYIRHGSKWDAVFNNFLRLKKEKFNVEITQTISFMNYANLANFYKLFTLENLTPIHYNVVHDPAFLSPAVLPQSVIDYAHSTFEGVIDVHKYTQLKQLFNITDIRNKPTIWEETKDYTIKLDNIRKQNIETILPEFKGLIYV
jgi:sulfatase maturation enzyme AslB (radical SAM superfamily)